MIRIASCLVAFGALNACTHMESEPVSLSSDAISGFPYAIPALELELIVKRRLADCTIGTNSDGLNVPMREFVTEVEAKTLYPAADWFTLDYSAMSGPTKTSTFTATRHANDMLATINIMATDKGPELIGKVVKAGISAASIIGGLPLPAAAGAVGDACPQAVRDLLDARIAAVTAKKGFTETLTTTTDAIDDLNRRAAQAELSEADKGELARLIKVAADIKKAMAAQDKIIAKKDELLTFSETVAWRPKRGEIGEKFATIAFDLDPATPRGQARVAWLKKLFPALDAAALNQIAPELALQLLTSPESSTAADVIRARLPGGSSVQRTRPSSKAGIVAVQPVRARVRICPQSQISCTRADAKLIHDASYSIPQLGPYVVLPFSNGFGEDNKLTAAFAENGSVTSVGYEDKAVEGLAILDGLNNALDQGLKLDGAIRKAREAERKEQQGAALKALQDEVALKEQNKKLLALEADLDPARQSAADALAQANAELAQAKVDIALMEARETLAGPTFGEQIDAMRAEIEVLKLKAELDKLRKEAGGD